MPGATVTKLPRKQHYDIETVVVTPEMAMNLLEHNKTNRPITQSHVHRIASQIVAGKWRFNGDTIKVAETGDVLDGQHRLWAIIEAKKSVETIIVNGISKDAFATIDTIRRPRSGADVLSLHGLGRHRKATATALTWLIRWQRGIEDYRAPQNRVENADVEEAFANHPGIIRAVDRASVLRSIANTSIVGFLYYILANRDPDLAERMISTLETPEAVPLSDPFFRLRAYYTGEHHKKKDPLITIALTIKAINAAFKHEKIQSLTWRSQGKSPEAFPVLKIGRAS